jgi:dolichol-phosphate mannosyltransferase
VKTIAGGVSAGAAEALLAAGPVFGGHTVWVVLPAYNEAVSLPPLLEALAALPAGVPWRAVVVDDGSTDGTGDVARRAAARLPVEVLAHPQNRGLAAALRTGLEHACARAASDDAVVTMDADNTHNPAQIPQMLAALAAGADVVVASRYVRGARQVGVPAHRAILSAGVGWLLRVRFGLPGVRDYSCGYRAYRARLLQTALARYGPRLIEAGGFDAAAELLVKLAPLRPRVVEVPLVLRYDRKPGPSKMPAARTILGYLRLVTRAPRAPTRAPRTPTRAP